MHEIFDNVVWLPVESLRDDPKNRDVHADIDTAGRDAWLLEDIKEHGVLMPLLVKQDRMIRDGHRRRKLAAIAGKSTVPCIVLKSGTDAEAFNSAQLHRTMSLYAKCVLYREKLADLIRRGDDVRERNLKLRHGGATAGAGGAQADDSILNQDWIKCEEVLGVSRRNLTAGVKLLESLERMIQAGTPDGIDRANRVLSIFRNRGLKPAARMLGEKTHADDSEPDVIDWQADDDEPEAPAKKGRSKSAGVVKFAKRDTEPSAPWIAEVFKCLGRIETLSKQHNAYSPVVQASLNAIEKDINGETAKRAA